MDYLLPGQDSRLNWTSINELERGRRQIFSSLNIRDEANSYAKRRPSHTDPKLHPFAIYQCPTWLRSSTSEDDWRKVRVRAGRVCETDASGTDGYDSDPDCEVFPDVPDITIPDATAAWWFWLEITPGTPTAAEIRYGTSPSAGSYSGAGINPDWTASTPWTGYPVPDLLHIPIGKVDTLTFTTEKEIVIRQYLRHDIILGLIEWYYFKDAKDTCTAKKIPVLSGPPVADV